MNWVHAVFLGVVEGVTEFLPVSSTGHLILASEWLGLRGGAVKTFEVVIQAGAISAVLGLYWPRVRSMGGALLDRGAPGARLAVNLLVSFLPAAALGLALHGLIKEKLFGTGPVIFALALGGLLMLWVDSWFRWKGRGTRELDSMTARDALWIGLAQCFALWPGTSRAMATILAGMLIGLSPVAAAEYSFLLALPTLGAAALLDAVAGGPGWVRGIGWSAAAAGFLTAALVAAATMRGLIRYLNSRGLSLFGWYRLGLAGLVWLTVR
ncbi:MAG: undecaprenyl-diphosphate phosphatase [Candidatus Omnitrophica bacterium]|nr:undecaprenyl-diphosphate phosphatase [Candidatus Omnitrophota bacterium]